MTADSPGTDTPAPTKGQLPGLLDPIRQWKSPWWKLVAITLVTYVIGFPLFVLSLNVAITVLSDMPPLLALAIVALVLTGLAGMTVLPAVAMSYCTHTSEQEPWNWSWKSVGSWSIATACATCGYTVGTVGTGAVGVMIFDSVRVQQARAELYSHIVQREFSESEAVDSQGGAVPLVRFRPAATGKEHRIVLHLNDPYEFPQTDGSSRTGKVFFPTAELRIATATGGIVRSTTLVTERYVPTMAGSFKPGFQEGIPSEMSLEFVPRSFDDHVVEFVGPPKGFAKYKVMIEGKGIE
ncbi:hypothetical protein Mal4_18630 [Maioricimonas rarisocia]|uniref:Uncharacterized protein n=1 Tax=Maioricimonas rarisocia TaxID=2528026 RepID=A0A517Z522_9PLAN|nr:hypothetical protein [Maioricimonas rarisocia]QDU37549.1 hypothetical protein Mal4_18630 [Maioricimonas rarisocia]